MTYCIAHGTLLSVMWQTGWEGSLGENGYMYMYGCIPLLFTWDFHSTVTPFQSKKFFFFFQKSKTPKYNPRRSQSAFSRTLSPMCVRSFLSLCLSLSLSLALVLSLSLSCSLSLSLSLARCLSLSPRPHLPTHSSTLFSLSLGFSCYLLNKMEL